MVTTTRLGPLRTTYPVVGPAEMPALLADQILQTWPERVSCPGWKRSDQAKGSARVYFTDDFRFSVAWNKPDVHRDALVASEAVAVAELDETIAGAMPEKLHAVYRIRWCARHWQAAGLDVIPNLTWDADDPEESVWWTCAGIPREPAMAIVEARPKYLKMPTFRAGMLAALEHVRPRKLLCYGGLPDFLPDWVEARWCQAFTPHNRLTGNPGFLRAAVAD